MPLTALKFSPYGYTPTEYVCIIFVALFSSSTILHVGQATYYRLWWLFPSVCLAGILEILGWSGRLWSSISPFNFEPYELQIVCTIMGPTPLAAANFIVLGHIIKRLGSAYSRLTPKLYTTVFLCCDIISLVVQGIGGGMAAGAVNRRMDPAKGGHVMLGGIAFQMVTITVYALCAGEFLLRYLHDRPIASRGGGGGGGARAGALSPRMKALVCALVFNTTCLFIRAVYRLIELSNGWSGRIIHTQVYFNVLDGAMITLAMVTLNVAHPGALLETRRQPVAKDVEGDGASTPSEKP
ncbi:RTA1 like protein-domain-containing protein [Mycena sp. CBHHK59/15]|nr:RTA1 like protein-domain-containing protein [Mycena sp. CBHHK59/15]